MDWALYYYDMPLPVIIGIMTCFMLYLHASCLRVNFDIKITHLFSVGSCFKHSILFHPLPSTFVYTCYSCVPCKQHRTGFCFLIHSANLYFYLEHLVCLHLPSEPPGKPSGNSSELQVKEANLRYPWETALRRQGRDSGYTKTAAKRADSLTTKDYC